MSRRYSRRCGGRPHLLFGLLLVAWGALALLDSLGIVELRSVLRTFWPLLLIVWGLGGILFGMLPSSSIAPFIFGRAN